MNQVNESKPVDLLVMVTRLHSNRGEHDDEFLREWCLPQDDPGHSGVLRGAEGVTGFWVWSEKDKKGLVVLHGCEDLLDGQNGAFQRTVTEALTRSGVDSKGRARLAVFAHGRIKETNTDLGMEGKHRPLCNHLENAFESPLLLSNYSLGNGPAALTVPRILGEAGIEGPLVDMVKAQLKLEPSVDIAVRSMQHIVFEMRLWCDLHLNARGAICDVSDNFQQCCARINSEEHWNNMAIKKVRFFQTLKEFLEEPLNDLVKNLFERAFNQDGLAIERIAAKTEALGDPGFLDCESEFLACLADERLPKQCANAVQVDRCLRALATRLELLIAAAAEDDSRRGQTSRVEVVS